MTAEQLRTFKLTVAYDGTDFAGWQVQPGEPTIQAALESAMQRITQQSIQVIGSGRTDAGVHAVSQAASCTLPWRDSADRLAQALNANLPPSIMVRSAVDAPEGFHAIRDAVGKRYRYQIQLGGRRDPFTYRFRWHLFGKLDMTRMQLAADRLVGRHDFAAFQAAKSDRKTTVRHVRRCQWFRQPDELGEGEHWAMEIEADGFLYNMVRNIVGTLIEVGRDKQQPDWIDTLIEARCRDLAGQTAPAQGLFLMDVDYGDVFPGNSTAASQVT